MEPVSGSTGAQAYGLSARPSRLCTDRGSRSGGPRVLPEKSLNNDSANTELPTDLQDAVTIRPKFEYPRLHRRFDPTPAQLSTACPCASETCVHPFPNDPTLELGKHAKHLKHGLSRGGRSIES